MTSTYIPKELRARVAAQAQYRCGYCLTAARIIGTALEIEHILPTAQGGLTVEANLWLACSPCNGYKNDQTVARDAETGTIVSLFNPRTQVWAQHFAWSENSSLMLGFTTSGRATISLLRLNRPVLVLARQLWHRAGWHPPQD